MEASDRSNNIFRLTRHSPTERRREPSTWLEGLPKSFMARGPSIAVIEDDFSFASSLMQLAEAQELAVSCFWDVETFLTTPKKNFDVVFINEKFLHRLEQVAAQKLQDFAASQIYVREMENHHTLDEQVPHKHIKHVRALGPLTLSWLPYELSSEEVLLEILRQRNTSVLGHHLH